MQYLSISPLLVHLFQRRMLKAYDLQQPKSRKLNVKEKMETYKKLVLSLRDGEFSCYHDLLSFPENHPNLDVNLLIQRVSSFFA